MSFHSSLPQSLTPPRTYAQWSACFEVLLSGQDDESVLEAMALGTGGFEAGVVQNIGRRLTEVFDARLQQGHQRFERQLSQSGQSRRGQGAYDVTTLTRALLDFRRLLTFLHRVASIEAFPATIQTHLNALLDGAAQSTQASLEHSAREDCSGQLLSCVRGHSLLSFRAGVPTNTASTGAQNPDSPQKLASEAEPTPTGFLNRRPPRTLL